MSRTIHGQSTKALRYLREGNSYTTLWVYWVYVARMNDDGVAWPSARGLAHDLSLDKDTCLAARDKLVELGALKAVPDYERPDWKKLPDADRARRRNLDKAEYFRPMGFIEVEGKRFPLLYTGTDHENDIDEPAPDVGMNPTSSLTRHQDEPDVGMSGTELNSILGQGDSKEPQLDSMRERNAPDGANPAQPTPVTPVVEEKKAPAANGAKPPTPPVPPPPASPKQGKLTEEQKFRAAWDAHAALGEALLRAFGFDLSWQRPSELPRAALAPYLEAAKQLDGGFHVDDIPGLHAHVAAKAKAGNWSGFGPLTLVKYSMEYRQQQAGLVSEISDKRVGPVVPPPPGVTDEELDEATREMAAELEAMRAQSPMRGLRP